MYNPDTREITTQRLILRPFHAEDAKRVSELCNNINIYKSTSSLPYPYPVESALAWIQNHDENFISDKSYEFAITDKLTGEIYGAIGLSNHKNNKNGEIGYWIGEDYWGKGYATEALRAIVDFAFSVKDYHKVWGRFFDSNPSSGKVMQKVGLVYEGLLKEHILKDGKYEDLILYGLIKN